MVLTDTPKREKCIKVAGEYLDEGKSVAVGTYALSNCTACFHLRFANNQTIQTPIPIFEVNGLNWPQNTL
jgi:hypothetical protein